MPKFSYVAMDNKGKETKGTLEVASQNEAIGRIKEMNLFPTKIVEVEKAAAGAGVREHVRALQQRRRLDGAATHERVSEANAASAASTDSNQTSAKPSQPAASGSNATLTTYPTIGNTRDVLSRDPHRACVGVGAARQRAVDRQSGLAQGGFHAIRI